MAWAVFASTALVLQDVLCFDQHTAIDLTRRIPRVLQNDLRGPANSSPESSGPCIMLEDASSHSKSPNLVGRVNLRNVRST